MNISFIIGNLGADAEVKEANGAKFITLSIADTRKYKSAGNGEQVVTNWVDAVIPNAEHPILPYLKQGVKVAIVGQSSLRVYSSKKDRCMKAGQTIHVLSIELCGGSSDDVPRQLINPKDGSLHEVQKYYFTNPEGLGLKENEDCVMVDTKGNEFVVQYNGWIASGVRQGEPTDEEVNDEPVK